MKILLAGICYILLLVQGSAQSFTTLTWKGHPTGGTTLAIEYDTAGASFSGEIPSLVLAVFYKASDDAGRNKISFPLEKSGSLWGATINVPDSTVLVSLVFMSADGVVKDNNNNKGYLLPVYRKNKPMPFAFSTIAGILGEGPADAAMLKKDHPRALAMMKEEFRYHPEAEPLFTSKFYNMLANSPDREDKVILIKKLTTVKTDKEPDLMMAQVYLSFFGSKQQADSLDRLLMEKFPDGQYVKNKKLKQEEQHAKTEPATEVHAVATAPAIPKEKIYKEVVESMIDEPVASITLKDVNGHVVSLGGAELKGKVVVLDFWAAWCKPCIASFPAISKVMDRYKDNKDIVFFFINTMEEGNAVKKVKDFTANNSYPFHFLVDERTNDMNLYKAFTNYKVAGGIPYKLVLDGRGNIRFRKSGFSGNGEDLVNELTDMIEIARKGQ